MKLTINFDQTKVVVPCSDGQMTIRELTSLGIERYKHAVGKPDDFELSVTSLKSGGSGGVLDPDDFICDVCDDKEDLIAEFSSPKDDQISSNTNGDKDKDICTTSEKEETKITATVVDETKGKSNTTKPAAKVRIGLIVIRNQHS